MDNYLEMPPREMKKRLFLILNLWKTFLQFSVPIYVEERNALGDHCLILADRKRGSGKRNNIGGKEKDGITTGKNYEIDLHSKDDLKCLYDFNAFALKECLERAHKREDYFLRYHSLRMSNYKEIGLIAFWISKFKPFHLNPNFFVDSYSFKINEEFALYFIFNSIFQLKTHGRSQKANYDMNRIGPNLYNEMLYTMQYRDLSKEAYGVLVEWIAAALQRDMDE